MFKQLSEHIQLEKHSREVVDSLNKMGGELLLSSNDAVFYLYTQNKAYLTAWERGRKDAFQMLDHVKQLSAGKPEETKDVQSAFDWLQKISGLLDKMVSLDRDKELGTMASLHEYIKKNNISEQIKPLFDEQVFLENVMAREKVTGQKLSAEREGMIKNLQFALMLGILVNVLISSILSIFLMRSITSRLQHVMNNMSSLAKREPLSAPLSGSDEIAYLDRTLFETGKHLLELETFKRELISIVSHELRTPLLSIQGTLELFEAGIMTSLSEKGNNRLKIAQEEAARLIRLINDLLDIEKMEAGKFILDKSEVDISDVVGSSISSVIQLADPRRIKVESRVPEMYMSVDRDRICQVLINLLSNAIKYSPEGGAVKVTCERSYHEIKLNVCDQGRGIPSQLKDKIFDRFVQVEKADATERGGTGLGLAIARAIVEQHGGTIGVDSVQDIGSTFWFTIPTAEGLRQRLAESASDAVRADSP